MMRTRKQKLYRNVAYGNFDHHRMLSGTRAEYYRGISFDSEFNQNHLTRASLLKIPRLHIMRKMDANAPAYTHCIFVAYQKLVFIIFSMISDTIGAFTEELDTESTVMKATCFPGYDGDQNKLEGDIFAVGSHVAAADLKHRYALSKTYFSSNVALKSEHDKLCSFYTEPVQINRRRKKIDNNTMEGYTNTLLDYLGFVKRHCHAKYNNGGIMSLRLVTRGELLQKYLNFKKARDVSGNTLAKSCQHLIRVLEYINATEYGADDRGIVKTLIRVLETVKSQIQSEVPARQRRSITDMREEGTWVDWVLIAKAAQQRAEEVVAQCDRNRTRILDGKTASGDLVHLASDISDVLLLLLLTIIPPTRPRTFRTLVLRGKLDVPPVSNTHSCTLCSKSGCKGNYLRRVALNHYELMISHHKTVNRTKEVIGPMSLCAESSTSTHLIQVGIIWKYSIYPMPLPLSPPYSIAKLTKNASECHRIRHFKMLNIQHCIASHRSHNTSRRGYFNLNFSDLRY